MSAAEPIAEPFLIDVWSDVGCPWCAIGKANLETALGSFAHSAGVEVVWHSYELDPDAPAAEPAGDDGGGT